MKTTKKTLGKSLLAMVLVVSLVCGCIYLPTPKQASAKAVAKVTKTITIKEEENPDDTGTYVCHGIKFDKKEKIVVKVKFLQVKGKLSKRALKENMFGGFEDGDGKGPIFSIKKNSFKKGKVLGKKNMSGYYLQGGKTLAEWSVPDGIKLLKMKVTYYTLSGKAGIKSVKNLSSDDDPYMFLIK